MQGAACRKTGDSEGGVESSDKIHRERQVTDVWVVGGLATKLCLTLVTPWTVAFQVPLST